MELLEFVELVTVAVTFLLMASGIPACQTMIHTGITHNVPYILFLVSVINSVLALYYGILVNNSTFILINAVGLTLWGLYVLVYIGVSKSKSKPVSQLLLSLMILAGHGLFLSAAAPTPPALTNVLGSFLFFWSVLLILTPLLDIMDMVQRGSSAGTDYYLFVGGTVCCLAWLVYGYLLGDFFVYGPNVLGLAVNGAKLATIAAYSGSWPAGAKLKEQ